MHGGFPFVGATTEQEGGDSRGGGRWSSPVLEAEFLFVFLFQGSIATASASGSNTGGGPSLRWNLIFP